MKFYIGLLSMFGLFHCGMLSSSSEAKIRYAKGVQQQQTFFEQLAEDENRYLGQKVGYGLKAAGCYKKYVQATTYGQMQDVEHQWLEFQKYRNKFHEAPTPVAVNIGYAGFGYWLYHRLAYPVHKKNWGTCKKTVASIIIPVWLFKNAILSDPELDKKMKMLHDERENKCLAIEQKCSRIESEWAEERRVHNLALERCYAASDNCRQERDQYRNDALALAEEYRKESDKCSKELLEKDCQINKLQQLINQYKQELPLASQADQGLKNQDQKSQNVITDRHEKPTQSGWTKTAW